MARSKAKAVLLTSMLRALRDREVDIDRAAYSLHDSKFADKRAEATPTTRVVDLIEPLQPAKQDLRNIASLEQTIERYKSKGIKLTPGKTASFVLVHHTRHTRLYGDLAPSSRSLCHRPSATRFSRPAARTCPFQRVHILGPRQERAVGRHSGPTQSWSPRALGEFIAVLHMYGKWSCYGPRLHLHPPRHPRRGVGKSGSSLH